MKKDSTNHNIIFILILAIAFVSSIYLVYAAPNPSISSLVMNSTSGLNTTLENLTAYATLVNTTNVIYDWRLNGTSIAVFNANFDVNDSAGANKTKDYSLLQNNGTITKGFGNNFPNWDATGGINGTGAFVFMGLDGSIRINNNTGSNVSTISVLFWIKPSTNATGSIEVIIIKGTQYKIYLNASDRKLSWSASGISNISSWSPPSNVWSHVAVTNNGSNLTFYVNGVVNSSFLSSIGSPGINSPVIGADAADGTGFNGTLDEFRIYNHILSAQEINTIYNNRSDIIVSQELQIGDNWTVCVTPNNVTTDGVTNCTTGLLIVNPYTSCPSTNGNWTVSQNYILNKSITCDNVTITNGSTFTFGNGTYSSIITNNFYLINATITENGNNASIVNITANIITIDNLSRIDVRAKGYIGGGVIGGNGEGPGGGWYDSYYACGGGAVHGGMGGDSCPAGGDQSNSASYDDIIIPTMFGSGGAGWWTGPGGKGGGVVLLNAISTVIINGSILADGENGTGGGVYDGGGGSGGSILIYTATLSGNGIISNIGGVGSRGSGGGGGGGRVSFNFKNNTFSGIVNISGSTGKQAGGIGTLFQCQSFGNMSCPGNIGNISLNTTYGITLSQNITRNLTTDWNYTNAIWNETATTPAAVTYYIYNLTNTNYDITLNNINVGTYNASNNILGPFYLSISTSQIQISNTSSSTCNRVFLFNYTLNTTLNCEYITIMGGSVFTFSNGTNSSINATSVIITNATVTANSLSIVNITAINLTIDALSIINVSGDGYVGGVVGASGAGPGGGIDATSGCGGTYGGVGGGCAFSGYGNVTTNGNITNPISFGSGGGGSNQFSGGSGGGIILLNVTLFDLEGILSANGISGGGGSGYPGGGGSGGTIYITTNNLSGNGTISTIGGNAGGGTLQYGGAGSGGRIAIYYTNNNLSGNILNTGGNYSTGGSGASVGGAGTTYLLDTTTNDSTLIITNNLLSNIASTNISSTISDGKFTNLNITNATIYGIVLNITKKVTFNPGTIYFHNQIIGTSNVTISNNSILKVNGNALNFINISANIINILAGGSINVSGNGYAGGGVGANGAGPGGGIYAGAGCGGTYGGVGGNCYSASYGNVTPNGNITNPINFGSGGGGTTGVGGGNGGGVILLNAITINVNGSLIADGTTAPSGGYPGGGGSGGTIYITTNNLSGNGTISTIGGNEGVGTLQYGGAGGGGRIAIYYNNNDFSNNILNTGGNFSRGGSISVGGAGTTYLFDTTTNDSTLIINNGIYSNTAITNISNTISDGKFTNLNITNTTIYGTALNITKTVTFNPGTIYLNTPIIGNSNVTITNNSILTVTGNALNLINITANTINIVSGSAINVTGKGYAGGSNTGNGAGPGYGIGSSLGSCGASYAGMGGKGYGVCTINTITYGDIINPMMFGSGGGSSQSGGTGGAGGGVILLTAINLALNGTIISRGENGANGGSYIGSGGSGGSIYISATTINGIGSFDVRGGDTVSSTWPGGPGGGGRISIMSTNAVTNNISVGSGNAASGYLNGTSGSVFLCTSSSNAVCPGNVAGIALTTNFSVNTTINITRNITTTWNQTQMIWTDNSTNNSNIGTYAIQMLIYPNYKLLFNNVFNNSLYTPSGILDNFSKNTTGIIISVLAPNDTAPIGFNITMNGTLNNPTSLYAGENFTCYVNTSDVDDFNSNVYLTIYNGTTAYAQATSIIPANNIFYPVGSVGEGTTNAAENWTCQIVVGDAYFNLTARNISRVTASNSIPITYDNIVPASAFTNDTLLGWCNGTDGNNDKLSYYWQWFRNGTSYSSGFDNNGGSNYTQGINRNLANVDQSITAKNENWTFSCLAYDGQINSTWKNTSVLIQNWVTNILLLPFNSSRGFNTTLENLAVYPQMSSEIDNDALRYAYDWRVNGTSLAIINMNFDINNSAGQSMTRDYSMYANNGTMVGNVTWNGTAGYNGSGAYTFDGRGGMLNFSTVPTRSLNNWTLVAWIKPANINQYGAIVYNGYTNPGVGNGYAVTIGNCGGAAGSKLCGLFGSVVWIDSGYTFSSPNIWYHVVMTRDSTNTKFYVNGVLTTTQTAATPLTPTSFTIGAANNGTNYPYMSFNGSIDEVRVYNRSLTSEQVRELYNNNTNKINWREINTGENWSVCVYPNDGQNESISNCTGNITILPSNSPIITVAINSSRGLNTSGENINSYSNTSDVENDTVFTNYDWRLNGTSIAVLNMYFDLKNNSGLDKTRDYSTYNNICNLTTNSPLWDSAGGVNSSGTYYFNGLNQYIDIANSAAFDTQNLTISVFINPQSITTQNGHIFEKGSVNTQYSLFFSGSILYFRTVNSVGTMDDLSVTTTTAGITNNNWSHIAAVYDGSAKYIYVNGILVGEKNYNMTLKTGQTNERIGAYGGGAPSYYFNGYIDNLQVYNRALSWQEIQLLDNVNYSSIHAEELRVGNWSVCATPNDQGSDGATVCTNNITITQSQTPTATIVLNSTFNTNTTAENLTAYITYTDVENDSTYACYGYDWRINGTSLAVLNMNFDTDNSAGPRKVRDYSTNGNNGTMTDLLWRPDIGLNGTGAYRFGGSAVSTSNYITVPNSPSLNFTNKLSISVWMNASASSSNGLLMKGALSNSQGVYSLIYDTNILYFRLNGVTTEGIGQVTTPSIPQLVGNWTHIVATYDGVWQKIYVNGVLTASQPYSTNITVDNNALIIGGYYNAATYLFKGTLDNLMLFNRSLSQQEITAIYNNQSNIIVSNELHGGDNWSACITPCDGSSEGEQACSNGVSIIFNNAPVATLVMNSSRGYNSTTENLTAYATVTDSENNPTNTIYDWRINGTSLAVVNMNFDLDNSAGVGKTKDYSSYANNGSVTALFNSNGGWNGSGAYQFNAVNTQIDLGTGINPLGNGQATLSAWINCTNPSSSGLIIFKGNDATTNSYGIYISGTSAYIETYQAGLYYTYSPAGSIAANTWYQITGVYNNGTMYLYINGVLIKSATYPNTLANTTNSLWIGAQNRGDPYKYRFNGTIDNVLILNRALSPEQVRNLYNNNTRSIFWREVQPNDNWSACVIPNDGTSDGAMVCSNNITIVASQAPTTTLNLYSTGRGNTTNENIIANATFADNENDPVDAAYDWRLNGTGFAVLNMNFDVQNSAGTNKTRDYSTSQNNGTIYGTALWYSDSGVNNTGAYRFDGTSTYIASAPNTILQPATNVSLSAWIYPKSTKVQSIAQYGKATGESYGIAVDLFADTTNKVQFAFYNGAWRRVDSDAITLNTWTHVVGTYDGTTLKIYINGVLKNTTSYTGTLDYTTPNGLNIGSYYVAGMTNYFNGTIDNVMVFNRTLTPQQILAIYQNTQMNTITSSELVGGQNWTSCVTPNDGYSDGATTCASILTISGTNISSVNITSPAYTDSNLIGWCNATSTASSNVSYYYQWYENGTLFSSGYSNNGGLNFTQGILVNMNNMTNISNTTKGDNWTLSCTAYDGYANSSWVNASVIINNTPPIINSIVLNSTNGTNTAIENLTAYVINSDADSDITRTCYDWQLNGTSIAVLNMNFDVNNSNGTGRTRDYSTYGNNGTVVSATWNATGGYNGSGAYNFSGSRYIEMNASSSLNSWGSKITVSAWVYQTSAAASQVIAAQREGCAATGNWQFYSITGTGMYFNFWNTSSTSQACQSSVTIPLNQWIHVAATYNGSLIVLYQNGTAVYNCSAVGPIKTTALKTRIGDESCNNWFKGYMDNVQIYNRSLSPQQISALYNNRTDLIVSQELTVGNNWSVCATPNDGYSDGNTTCSNNLIVVSPDSCTPPGSGNWNINAKDNCTKTNQNIVLSSGKLIISGAQGAGSLALHNTNITANDFQVIGAGSITQIILDQNSKLIRPVS